MMTAPIMSDFIIGGFDEIQHALLEERLPIEAACQPV
jgi:hypothetical protein